MVNLSSILAAVSESFFTPLQWIMIIALVALVAFYVVMKKAGKL